jgi:hypothetical protein
MRRCLSQFLLLFCCSLFLGMVVWQPFPCCWRYIIARVSEMHVAYHRHCTFVVYLHHRNVHNKTRPLHLLSLFSSYLRSIVPAVRCKGRKCIVLGLCNTSLSSSLSQFLLFLLLIIPQYGRLAAVFKTGVISLRVSPKCTSHIIKNRCLWVISSSEC